MRVEKDWGNTAQDRQLPVAVELCRNNTPLSSENSFYRQTLSADNSWTHEWTDLPVFIDGKAAEYSLREVKIGDTAYDGSADSDGYENYQVTSDAPVYWQGENGAEHDTAYWDEGSTRVFAGHMRLTVHNSESKGLISFSKVDEKGRALAGAHFALYSDEDCSNQLQTVESNAAGLVAFDAVPAGTYYLKETSAPTGYKFDADAVYKATVSGGAITITKIAGTNADEKAPITSVSNRFSASLRVVKLNQDGNPLAGAEFTLYQDGNAAGSPFTTNDAGIALFDGELQDGTYQLQETKAPNGYCSLQTEATITVDKGVVTTQLPEDGNWSYAGTEEGSATCTFTVINNSLYSMPTTGGIGVVSTTAIADDQRAFGAASPQHSGAFQSPAGRYAPCLGTGAPAARTGATAKRAIQKATRFLNGRDAQNATAWPANR